ncbi:MAG: hypothetical protein ACETWM_02005 [Candidatus Lokiarchaeia archaeon]
MKGCQNCKIETELGILSDAPIWSRWNGVFYRKACEVSAHRCPKCGYIMLYEKEK